MDLEAFHPALSAWFRENLGAPTAVQAAAWPAIAAGECVLVSAPTGSGKTLAGWLPLLDRMLKYPASGPGVRVLYISPLRALSRDLAVNLAGPLDALGGAGGVPRIGLRTGDTPAAERAAQRRKPPELLVTTPESAFVLLGSAGGRRMLGGVEAVIVDEIHALAGSKRGAHLALSLERLEARLARPLKRIGISATVRPLEAMASFLGGFADGRPREVAIVEPERAPVPEVVIERPECLLGPFAHGTHMRQIHDRIADLAREHRSVLVFCRTRAQVERSAGELAARLGAGAVAAHHGSLGRSRRREIEQAFKGGGLKLVVSSASLELGLDLGSVDLVCQLGAPGSVNLFRQRAGRACHRPGERPHARLFPLTLNEALEAEALVEALGRHCIEPSILCPAPRDVLAQHLTAMVAAGERDPDTIFALVRRAFPWAGLERSGFDRLLECLTDGFVPGREGHRALIAREDGGRYLAPRQDAGRVALANAGTIPEWFECPVFEGETGRELGRLDEEFAFESAVGQILQLGNQPWRITRMRPDRIEVTAAPDEVPNVPFWFGDGAGRTQELSAAVQARINAPANEFGRACRAVLGALPGPGRIVLERFPDPNGDCHLAIHTLAGARVNRAWGLALRKRFCRQFNFELQAAATEDGVVISLGPTHSFQLHEVTSWLKADGVEQVLTQALLDTPVFQTRFRWCATTALAIQRRTRSGPVPPQIQRSQTENLLARIFPDQLACLENLSGPREIPDHPLVEQALADCLEVHMDLDGLKDLLAGIESGAIEVHAAETAEPSPLARALIHAPRYSFLDPAAAEERRTRAFESPRRRAAENRVVRLPGTGTREFERGLIDAGYLLASEGETGVTATGQARPGGWAGAFSALVRTRAAVSVEPPGGHRLWVAVDRLPEILALWPGIQTRPRLPACIHPAPLEDGDEALCRLILGRAWLLGGIVAGRLAAETGLPETRIEAAIARLRSEGCLHRCAEHWVTRESLRAAAPFH